MVPKLFLSALTGRGVERIWGSDRRGGVAATARSCRPAQLNRVVGRAVEQQQPPMVKGKRARFLYATQTATAPPTVTIFTSAPERMTAAYERYLTNQIRAAFDLQGTPLRLRFRARERRDARAAGAARADSDGRCPATHPASQPGRRVVGLLRCW